MLSLTVTVFEAAFLLLLTVIFFSAACHKVKARRDFSNTLRDYQVVGDELLPVLAWLVPIVELAIAALIFTPYAQKGIAAAALLLSLYAMLMLITLWRGIRIADCGCGGPARRTALNRWPIARNALLAVIAVSIYVHSFSWQALPFAAWPIGLAAGLFIVLLYHTLEQLLDNQQNKKLLEARYA